MKKYRFSLFAGLILLLAGALAGISGYLAANGMMPAAVGSLIEPILHVYSFGDYPMSLSAGCFLFLEGLMILAFRRKKRATMILTFPYWICIYFTFLAYFHLDSGNPEPVYLMSAIDPGRELLVFVCAILEILLYAALFVVFSPLDKRIWKKQELRVRQQTASEEASSEEENAAPAIERDEKAGEKYRRDRERAEAKIRRKAEKEARKEEKRAEKKARKEAEKQERAESRAEAKAEKKAAKAAMKEAAKAKAAIAEDDSSESFTTEGTEYIPRPAADPKKPVVFPDIAELPELRTIHQEDSYVESRPIIEDIVPEVQPAQPEVRRNIDTDVFSEVKKEIERNEAETEEEEEERIHFDFKHPKPFARGGMLEATLENMMKDQEPVEKPRKPIIGFGDDRKEQKEKRNNSSFAPSTLSPDHPRYRMFESLTHSPNVSHFPSKAFVAEEESSTPAVSVKAESEESSIVDNPMFVKPEPEAAPEPAPIRSIPAASEPEVMAAEEPEEIQPKKMAAFDPFTAPQKKKVHVQEEAEEEAPPKQENELMLSVGIGGLRSNEYGYGSIAQRAKQKYVFPDDSILYDYPGISTEIDDATRATGDTIVRTLAEFNVDVELVNIVKGPTVTMYEIRLHEGTLVSKVTSKYNELSLNLGGVHIRILAPVPGKQVVGIEVPNKKRDVVGFKDMLREYKKNPDRAKLNVPMILGRTITGSPQIIDVAKMPHMLIAGTTGSGKSVCINTFICTVLYTRSPKEVRFIMIDPKVVELSIYNGIPHLLTPVITEPKKVVKALKWLCDEMDRRYNMLSRFGVRNIKGLNEKIQNERIPAEKLPYIVLIMDEFADIMTSSVGKDVDTFVARLTAKARAAGIHLVLATQRPSADVITGTIKSNFPARIAFAVSSGINSRIILDEQGAENLLGKGDMIFMDPTQLGNKRIQGAFLSDEEVDGISSASKRNGEPDYLADDIFEDEPEPSEDVSEGGGDFSDDDSDEVLYAEAKRICYERKTASASYLQRRMRIGYNRAARLIEMMEDDGIVGPPNGSKPREIIDYTK